MSSHMLVTQRSHGTPARVEHADIPPAMLPLMELPLDISALNTKDPMHGDVENWRDRRFFRLSSIQAVWYPFQQLSADTFQVFYNARRDRMDLFSAVHGNGIRPADEYRYTRGTAEMAYTVNGVSKKWEIEHKGEHNYEFRLLQVRDLSLQITYEMVPSVLEPVMPKPSSSPSHRQWYQPVQGRQELNLNLDVTFAVRLFLQWKQSKVWACSARKLSAKLQDPFYLLSRLPLRKCVFHKLPDDRISSGASFRLSIPAKAFKGMKALMKDWKQEETDILHFEAPYTAESETETYTWTRSQDHETVTLTLSASRALHAYLPIQYIIVPAAPRQSKHEGRDVYHARRIEAGNAGRNASRYPSR